MHVIGITGQTGAGKDVIASRLVDKHKYVQVSLADPIKRFGLNVFGFDVVQLWGPGKNRFDPSFHECNLRSSNVKFEPGCHLASVKKACDQAWGDAALRLTSYGPGWVQGLVEKEQQDKALKDLYFWFASLGHHYPEISPRIMLQHLGTEWGRECVSEDIWVKKLIKTAESVTLGYKYTRETGLSKIKGPRPKGVVVADVRFPNELERIKKVGGTLVRVTREDSDRKAKNVGIKSHASEEDQKSIPDDKFDCIFTNNGSISDLQKAVDVAALTFKGK